MRRWNLIMRVFMCEYLGLKPDPLSSRVDKRAADSDEERAPGVGEDESMTALQRDSSELVSICISYRSPRSAL